MDSHTFLHLHAFSELPIPFPTLIAGCKCKRRAGLLQPQYNSFSAATKMPLCPTFGSHRCMSSGCMSFKLSNSNVTHPSRRSVFSYWARTGQNAIQPLQFILLDSVGCMGFSSVFQFFPPPGTTYFPTGAKCAKKTGANLLRVWRILTVPEDIGASQLISLEWNPGCTCEVQHWLH